MDLDSPEAQEDQRRIEEELAKMFRSPGAEDTGGEKEEEPDKAKVEPPQQAELKKVAKRLHEMAAQGGMVKRHIQKRHKTVGPSS